MAVHQPPLFSLVSPLTLPAVIQAPVPLLPLLNFVLALSLSSSSLLSLFFLYLRVLFVHFFLLLHVCVSVYLGWRNKCVASVPYAHATLLPHNLCSTGTFSVQQSITLLLVLKSELGNMC